MDKMTDSRAAEVRRCTCPSGDGSLRWPCPAHPPEAQAQGGGEVLGILRTAVEYHRAQATGPCDQFGNKASHRNLKLEAWHRQVADAIEAITAPPSAPVGVDGCTESNCPRCLTHPDHRGDMAHAGIGSYPAQQPAAVDRRHLYVQSKGHGGCANCGYPEWEPWHVLAAQPGGSDDDR